MTEIEKMRREQLQKECRNITGNFEEIGFLIGVEDVFYACARNKEDYEEFSSCCPTIFTSTFADCLDEEDFEYCMCDHEKMRYTEECSECWKRALNHPYVN